eukprot:7046653-Ditylum_brightwellii.AAC.1
MHSSFKPCKSCPVGKAKQKNAPKKSEHTKAKSPDKRIFLDIDTIKGEKNGPKVNPKRNW